jgi:sec-independent protein translocase protein TatA
MGSIGVPELLIVLAIIVLVLGPKRIPRAGRAMGRGIKEFKAGIGKKSDDDVGLPGASTAAAEPETLDGEVVRDKPR